MVAEIAVDKIKYSADKLYSYKVPNELKNQIFIGARVYVPFGNGGKNRLGIVLSFSEQIPAGISLKEINCILDEQKIVTEEMLFLAKYMKSNYYCSFFDGIRAMIPFTREIKVEKILKLEENRLNELKNTLSEQENKVTEFIKSKGNCLKGKACEKLENSYKDLIKKLKLLGVLRIEYLAKIKRQKKNFELIKLSSSVRDGKSNFNLTPKQKGIVEFFKSIGKPATVKEISYFTGSSKCVINTLLKKGVLEYYEQDLENFLEKGQKAKEKEGNVEGTKKEIVLTNLQNKVFEELKKVALKGETHTALIRGITGSGKTMILVSLIDFILKKNKSVIFMVPEIALTSQVIAMFKSRYGEAAAVIHSKLPERERQKEWERIQKGEVSIVVGTRTAVFSPVKNLGLIIMDEEHETSYKSEASPRFHARDIAVQRCKYNKSMLVLASATPSLESYFRAKSGVYSLHTLNERYGDAVLPEIEIIDMNSELMNGNPTFFSEKLVESLKGELEKGNQAILLLNRRGYNTFVRCRECKEPIKCPNCNITLNYHKVNNRLMCHYCGYSTEFLRECPKCHGVNIAYEGIGTQRAEFQLKEIFPEAKVLRVDTDSIDTEPSLEKVFKEFFGKKYNVMIGTQMIAKGLNFPSVTLVGVLMADQALYSDDFRSYERAFSLITQVVGRAGRGEKRGKAIIQTYTPENPVIGFAAKQNYEDFYKEEIEIRKLMLYPPFSDICYIGFTGKRESNVIEISNGFFEQLKEMAFKKYKDLPLRIYKPSPANVNKVCGKYRYRILIKCRNGKKFCGMMSEIMLLYEGIGNSKGVNIFANINPSFIE